MDAITNGQRPGWAAPHAATEPQIVESPAFAAPGLQGNDQNNCAGILTRARTWIKRWIMNRHCARHIPAWVVRIIFALLKLRAL